MRLVKDFKHEYKGFTGAPNGLCRIRIFSNEDGSRLIGICSALPENYTTSTTNVIEQIYLEVRSKFFEESIKRPNHSDDVKFAAIEEMATNLDGKKYFTLAVKMLKVLWDQKNKYKAQNPNNPPLLWVDHWPKSIGLRPWENEFSFLQFTEDLVPHWTHVSEEKFVEYTGIDLRLINELELAE